MIKILGQTAQLELYDLEANLVPPSIGVEGFPVATESLYALLAGQQSLVDEQTTESWYLFDDQKRKRAGPVTKKDALLQSKVVAAAGEAGKLPKGWRIFGVPPKTVVLACGIGENNCPGVGVENPTRNFYYLIRNGEFKNSDGS